jgi:transposase InsO family protein
LRERRKLGPARIGSIVGVPASTVHRVLCRHGMNRLAWMDRPTGQVIRRIHTDRPGELVHVDVKKLGRIPDGGGWRLHGLHADRRLSRHTASPGFDYIHVAVDDHSRVTYAEIHPDEHAATCAAFLHRAASWFHDQHHVTIRRVLTDNALTYRTSHDWTWVCHALQITRRFTKPGCPWTNGKAERFNRTLLTDWAYAQPWLSTTERTAAFDEFIDR